MLDFNGFLKGACSTWTPDESPIRPGLVQIQQYLFIGYTDYCSFLACFKPVAHSLWKTSLSDLTLQLFHATWLPWNSPQLTTFSGEAIFLTSNCRRG